MRLVAEKTESKWLGNAEDLAAAQTAAYSTVFVVTFRDVGQQQRVQFNFFISKVTKMFQLE